MTFEPMLFFFCWSSSIILQGTIGLHYARGFSSTKMREGACSQIRLCRRAQRVSHHSSAFELL